MKLNLKHVRGLTTFLAAIVMAGTTSIAAKGAASELEAWLAMDQEWVHDLEKPVLTLGKENSFDSSSVLATAVSMANTRAPKFWYTGAQGEGKERVFRIGAASTSDSVTCQKQGEVFKFPDGKTSALNISALRNRDGWAWRYGGLGDLLWVTGTRFDESPQRYAIYQLNSPRGGWTAPGEPILKNAASPQVIRDGNDFRLWYNDTSQNPWVIRHASAHTDTTFWKPGDYRPTFLIKEWKTTPEVVLKADQPWESGSLLSPLVLKVNDHYQMWYVAEVKGGEGETALGFAVSSDGLSWKKHPENPVFRPGKGQVISTPTVKRMPGGEFRIWYASRAATAPPYQCAEIRTMIWNPKKELPLAVITTCPDTPKEFVKWRDAKRAAIRKEFGIPNERVPLDAEKREEFEHDGIVIEKWIITTEERCLAPALLYRPKEAKGKMPAIVMTFGHGDSKSSWYCQYAAQVYAKLGIACLAIDPIGSEERHPGGVRAIGARGHDKPASLGYRAKAARRLVMGKLVFDFMRGIDFLQERQDIDPDRIGVAGNSLGGAEAAWLSVLEPRVKVALVSGWGYSDNLLYSGKECTRLPNYWLAARMSWLDLMMLSAPFCKVRFVNGAEDFHYVLAWNYLDRLTGESAKILKKLGMESNTTAWTEPEATHRPFHIHKESLVWLNKNFGTPAMTLAQIEALPVIKGGEWCKANGFRIEGFYAPYKSQTGCNLPNLGIRRVPQDKLLCLTKEELGKPEFTIEGWLEFLEKNSPPEARK